MKINKIRLQNIKSFIDQTIEFFDGVNFISGINGSGKSTIIESIGFALFNVKPPKIGELIRYGEGVGCISIWFEANDEREYRIVRRFSSSKNLEWEIYDVETGLALDLHGEKDIINWLTEYLGIGNDTEPDKLFKDIVGVDQGMFSAPFLLAPQKRIDLFNPILKVDSYRQAFQATSQCKSEMDLKINNLSHEIELNQQRVEKYDEKVDELSKLNEDIDNLTQRKSTLNDILTKGQNEYNNLKKIKESIEEKKKEKDRSESDIIRLESLLERINNDIQKAESAKSIVSATNEGYLKYKDFESRLKTLLRERKEKERIEQEKNVLDKQCVTLETEIRAEEQNIADQQVEIDSKLKSAIEESSGLIEQINLANIEFTEKAEESENIAKISKNIDSLQEYVRELEKNFIEIKRKTDEIKNIEKELDELHDRLKDYDKYKIIADTIEELKRKLEEKNNLIIEIKERIKTAQKNKERAKGGKCPFLGEDCKNVGGNLEEYFEDQIRILKDELRFPESEIAGLKSDLAKAENAVKLITAMDKDKDRLKVIEKRKSELYEEIKTIKSQITGDTIKSALITINGDLPIGETYQKVIDKIDDKFETLEEYDLTVELLNEYIKDARQSYNAINANIQEDLGRAKSNINSLNLKKKNLEKEIETLEEKQKRLNKKKFDINNKKESLNQKKLEFNKKQDALLKYEGLDEKITETEQGLNDCKSDYEENVRNQNIAEKLPGLMSQKTEKLNELQEKKTKLESLAIEVNELGQRFSAEYYSKLESKIKEIENEIMVANFKLEQNKKNRDILVDEISKMNEIKEHIKTLEGKLRNYQKAYEILEFIRNNVLNKAGDRIADIYRRNISVKASEIYRQVSNENVNLEWEDGYEIVLIIKSEDNVRRRIFKQLSGGEQMSAALAIRLALLGMLSNVKIGIFDEPTTNMDEQRRFNLAQVIPSVTKDFKQLFVISHDDSFDSITENVIHLQKTEEAGTVLVET